MLEERVAEATIAAAGVAEEQEVAVLVRQADGAVVAGAFGVIVGGCFDLQALWVAELLRGRGIARSLVEAAEVEARQRGCVVVTLHAYDVTTNRLFERLGYRAVGAVDNGFAGTAVRWYCKDLTPSDPPGVETHENGRSEPSEASRTDVE